MNTQELKEKLFKKCSDYIEQRIATAKNAMQAAQEAANESSKSSAGDKYETTRAMMQIERDKNATQLEEALKLKNMLEGINLKQRHDQVRTGALVETNSGTYFFCISAGKISIEGKEYFAIAPNAPLAIALKNKKAKEEVLFNGRKILVVEVN